jgi:tetratricopeptide (TPR) repeat protein
LAFENLKKLRSLPEQYEAQNTEDLEIRIFALSNSIELALHTESGNFAEGIKLVPIIEEGLIRFEDRLSSVRKASFYFNIAVLYFKAGHLNEALKWINQLLNNIEIDETQDIHCMAQILNLIIHLQLGNKSLLPYTMRSTQRYLETREKVYRFETVFLEFINEVLKKRTHKTERQLYEELVAQLDALREDPFEKQVFDYFDFREWAAGRIAGASTALSKDE